MPGRAGGVAPGGRTATHTESTPYLRRTCSGRRMAQTGASRGKDHEGAADRRIGKSWADPRTNRAEPPHPFWALISRRQRPGAISSSPCHPGLEVRVHLPPAERVTQTRSIPTDLEGLASVWRSLPVGAPLTVRRRPLTGASVVLAPTCAGECAWQIKRASSRRARRRADRLGRQGGMRQPVGAVPSVPAIFPASAWKQGPTITVSPTTVTSHCWVGIGSAARRRRRAVDQICSGRSP